MKPLGEVLIMKINWSNILEQAIGATISTVFMLLITYIINVFTGRAQSSFWPGIGIVIVILLVLWFSLKAFRQFLNAIGRWIVSNWQLVVGLALLLGVLYEVFSLTRMLLVPFLGLGLVLAIILLSWYCMRLHSVVPGSQLRFVENFERGLSNWQYHGEWHIEQKDGQPTLTVTSSEKGGIAKSCLLWTDYILEFETKIVKGNTSWIIRAKDTDNYVMLQCGQEKLYPHFRANGEWTNLPWTKQNPVSLPVTLPVDTWFSVRIEIRGMCVMVTLTMEGKEIPVPNIPNPLFSPPIAPIVYPSGSIGFRESGDEHAQFRKVSVKRL